MRSYILNIPKAELHIHIEGALEPELMFKIAKKNRVPIAFDSPDAIRKAYEFVDLQSFLDIYYQGVRVLIHDEDFYAMTMAYLNKAVEQNVRHTEIFFDPQAHTDRGIAFETVISGIHRALQEARQVFGISSKLIMCFLRNLSVQAAMETLQRSLPYKEWIAAVGLDSSERGYPPERFAPVFAKAREAGFLTVAHAGEEGPPEYIWQALERLKVSRIDHGVRCMEDPRLLDILAATQIPLTVCPLSNVKLKVFKDLSQHNLKELLDLGLCVTVNSDDPAYFGGYVAENFLAVQEHLNLDDGEIFRLAKNSFQASFITPGEKDAFMKELSEFAPLVNA